MRESRKKKFMSSVTSKKMLIASAIAVSAIAAITVEETVEASELKLITTVQHGDTLKIDGKEYWVVKHTTQGIKIIDKNPFQQIYDMKNTSSYNLHDPANIGYQLNNSYYNTLSEKTKSMIINATWNIGSDVNEASLKIDAKISLLTFSEWMSSEGNTTYNGKIPYLKDVLEWTNTNNDADNPDQIWYINENGNIWFKTQTGNQLYVRPAMVLRSDLYVDSAGNVIDKVPAPSNIIVPTETEESNTDLTVKEQISWTASTSPNIKGYKVDVTYDDGLTWETLKTADQQGTSTVYKYTAPTDKTGQTAKFRVTAVSNSGVESDAVVSVGMHIKEAQYNWNLYTATLEPYHLRPYREETFTSEDSVLGGSLFLTIDQNNGTPLLGSYTTVTSDGVNVYSYENGKVYKLWHRYSHDDSEGNYYLVTKEIYDIAYDENRYINKILSSMEKGSYTKYTNDHYIDGYWYERGQRVKADDITPPIIELTEKQEYAPTSTVTVRTHDLSTVSTTKWAQGEYTKDNFPSTANALDAGQSAETSFTVSENGIYTVYSEDDKGNKIVETINVTKVNTAPTVTVTERPTFVILDAEQSFNIKGVVTDPDPTARLQVMATQDSRSFATAETLNSGDTYTLNVAGNKYLTNGVFASPFNVKANDGYVDSDEITVAVTVIKVDDADEYTQQLENYDVDYADMSVAQHEAFFDVVVKVNALKDLADNPTQETFDAATDALAELKANDSVTYLQFQATIDYAQLALDVADAESSLGKPAYEDVLERVNALAEKGDLENRVQELGIYHEANDLLLPMDAEVAQPTGAEGTLNKAIINLEKLVEVRTVISTLPNTNPNKAGLSTRVGNLTKALLTATGSTITGEDLTSMDGQHVQLALGGWYEEYRGYFAENGDISNAQGTITTEGQQLIDFVNAFKQAFLTMDTNDIQTVNALSVPTRAESTKQSIVQYLQATQTYYTDQLSNNTSTAPTFPVANTPLSSAYAGKIVQAIETTFSYNRTQTEPTKTAAQNAINQLDASTFRDTLTGFVDNGLPSVVLTSPNYVQTTGTFEVTGVLTDTNDSTVAVTLEIGGLTATQQVTINATKGTFTLVSYLPKGVYEGFSIKAKDAYTTTSIDFTEKVVLTDNPTRFNALVTAELQDQSKATLHELAVTELQALYGLVDAVDDTTVSTVQDFVTNVLNPLTADRVAVKQLLESYVFDLRLQKLYETMGDATVSDFTELGLTRVTAENIVDMKQLVVDYKAHDSLKLFATSADYTTWATNLESLVQARIDVQAVLDATTAEGLATALTKATGTLGNVPTWITERTTLVNQLTGKASYQVVLVAVEKAEETQVQTDKNQAQVLVDVLPEGAEKTDLQNRLDELQATINEQVATDAITEAERTLAQADVDTANVRVQALVDGSVKDALTNRLNTVQMTITFNQAVTAATALVVKAETTTFQKHKDDAQALVTALQAGVQKIALQNRLDALQQLIDNKKPDIVDELVNNLNEVTPKELADFGAPEQVYAELDSLYKEDIQRVIDETGTITKEQVQAIIRLANAYHLVKLSMELSDVEVFTGAYTHAHGLVPNVVTEYYPTPSIVEQVSSYKTDDSLRLPIVTQMATMLQKDESSILAQLDELKQKALEKETAEITVQYVADDEVIFSETVSHAHGTVEVTANVPDGYKLVGEEVQTIELVKDAEPLIVTFEVEQVTLGAYVVKYQTEDNTVIYEQLIDAAYGTLLVVADLAVTELDGYTLIDELTKEQTVTLTAESELVEVIFLVKQQELTTEEGDKPIEGDEATEGEELIEGDEPTEPETESIISDTIGEETAFVRSLLIASLDDSFLTFSANVTPTALNNKTYLYQLFVALDLVKASQTITDESLKAVGVEYISTNVEDGSYKANLLGLLGVDIRDLNNGEDGLPNLTLVAPTPTPPTGGNSGGGNYPPIEQPKPIEPTSDEKATVAGKEIGKGIEELLNNGEWTKAQDQLDELEKVAETIQSKETKEEFKDYVLGIEDLIHDKIETLFQEKAEDITTAIAQEQFEEAQSLLNEGNQFIAKVNDALLQGKLQGELGHLQTKLAEAVSKKEQEEKPIVPKPNPKPDPKPPTDNNGGSPTLPPVNPKPNPIIVPQIPAEVGSTLGEKLDDVQVTTEKGKMEWLVKNPSKDVLVLTTEQGLEITVPIDTKFASEWVVNWVDLGNNHYKLEVKAKGKVYKVSAPIQVTFPHEFGYLLKQRESVYKAQPHTYKAGKFVFKTLDTGTFHISTERKSFKDIAKFDTKGSIEELASRHIIFGTSTDNFSPNAKMTRAQFAAMISRALGLEPTGENPFKDTRGKWFEEDVQALYEAGIISGTSATTFNPNAYVTRQQAAMMLYQVLKQSGQATETNKQPLTFTDSSLIAEGALQAVSTLEDLKIIQGKPKGQFDPHGVVTRSQMAKMLQRTLKITNDM